MSIVIDFDKTDPSYVEHDRQAFFFTGKIGTRFSDGRAEREMASAQEARLWITLDGSEIFEN